MMTPRQTPPRALASASRATMGKRGWTRVALALVGTGMLGMLLAAAPSEARPGRYTDHRTARGTPARTQTHGRHDGHTGRVHTSPARGGRTVAALQDARQDVRNALAELNALEDMIKRQMRRGVIQPQAGRRLLGQIEQSQRAMRAARRSVKAAKRKARESRRFERAPVMTSNAFWRLQNAVASTRGEARLAQLDLGLRSWRINARQAQHLLSVTPSREKLAVLRVLAPHLNDPSHLQPIFNMLPRRMHDDAARIIRRAFR